MTDRDDLVALFDRFGITMGRFGFIDCHWDYETPDAAVVIEALTGEKNDGYGGFFAQFNFTPDGQFEDVGIWE